jgi:p-aminobenzoyl-glutamate transporter AbgT
MKRFTLRFAQTAIILMIPVLMSQVEPNTGKLCGRDKSCQTITAAPIMFAIAPMCFLSAVWLDVKFIPDYRQKA